MVVLVPMTEAEYRETIEKAVPRHAANCVRRGEWAAESALEASRKEYETRHPQGVRTQDHFFVKILDEGTGERVGETWYSSRQDGGKVRFWVEWLWIEPEFRRRGHARRVLELLAQEAVRRGAERIGLYVFNDNLGAVALYTGAGFAAKSMSMVKEISAPAGGSH